jgi:hypothetical protein
MKRTDQQLDDIAFDIFTLIRDGARQDPKNRGGEKWITPKDEWADVRRILRQLEGK